MTPKVRSLSCLDASGVISMLLRVYIGSSMYSQSLYKLVSESYLKPSTILSHNSPRDKRIKYEAEEKIKISGLPTSKELREAKVTAEARLRREEEEAEKVGLVCFFWDVSVGPKRIDRAV